MYDITSLLRQFEYFTKLASPTSAPMSPRAQARLDPGSWLPLGSRENALEEMGHLFERSELCPIFSALSIFLQA